MFFRKAFGILFLCVQATIGTDYYIQTRDAGLHWGELSSAEYVGIVRARYGASAAPLAEDRPIFVKADPVTADETVALNQEVPTQVCVGRGTQRECD